MIRDLYAIFKTFSKQERAVFYAAFSVFLASLTFFSILLFHSKTELAPAFGGEYIEGIVGQPVAINPILTANNDADRDLIELAFADLSVLLERYGTSSEGTEFTITLKPELKWSDGEPLTSDDVIFTIETIQNPDAGSPLFSSWQGVVLERLSSREVRLTIKSPYIYFLDNVLSLKLIPRHIFESVPAANLRLSAYILEPVGNGPYAFVSFEKEKSGFFSEYRFEANEHFAGEKPYIEKIFVNFFQTYKDALAAFNRREIHGLGGVSPSQMSEVKIVHSAFEFKIPRYYALFFNQGAQPILAEDEVRQAIGLAINKKRIVNAVFLNHALIVDGPILPYLEGYDPNIYENDGFSPEAASSTLSDAGWIIGEDGVRVKGSADSQRRLSLELVVPQIPFLNETAQLIKQDLKDVGIELNLQVLPPLDINSSIITSRNYQMIIFGNLVRGNPDVFSFWHSSQRLQPGLNLAMYSDKDSDSILESVRTEPDAEKRASLLSRLQENILNDKPAVFLYSPNYLYLTIKNLGGLEGGFINTSSDRLKNINAWHLKTARRFK